MSSIDDRIVDMQFNNASFEKNVDTTIKSLANLNDALELKNASSGLDSVAESVKNVDLGSIVDGVQTISSKFNILGAVGLSVINNLTGALMGFAGDSINAVMDPLIEGGKRRAQNIEQAKFMIDGLGKSWNALYKDMDYAVSGTAFGIDAAAKAASQLSASSVKAGTDMKMSLRGISGVAAMTGSSYDDIAQIFTTVAGNGRLMASELNRISARGLNAAQALADFFNQGRTGAKLTEKDIRKMVSEGKVSFKDFAKAMDGAFGAQATKANETYAGSLSNVKSALSRIGASFSTPVFDKQRDVFNQLRLVINGVAKALNPLIDLWKKLQKAEGESTVAFLKGIEKAVGVLEASPNSQYSKDIAAYEKYKKKKDKLKKGEKLEISDSAKRGQALAKETKKRQDRELAAEKKYNDKLKKFKENGKKGKEPKKPQILVDKEQRAKTGNQEQTPIVQTIQIVAESLELLNNNAKAVFGAIGEAFSEAFPADPEAKSMLVSLAEAFKSLIVWLTPSAKGLDTFKKVLSGFFTVVKVVGTVISNAFQAIPGIVQVVIGVFNLLKAVFKPVLDLVSQVATSFLGMFTEVGTGVDIVTTVNDALTWLRENGIGKLLEVIGNATTVISEFWAGLGDGSGGNLFEGFDPFSGMLEKLKNFGAIMSDFFKNAWEWAKGIYESIKGSMGEFGSGGTGFFDGLSKTIENIKATLSNLFGDLKGGLAELFRGFDWSTLLVGIASGGFIKMIINITKSLSDFLAIGHESRGILKILKDGLSSSFDELGGALQRFGKDTKSDVIMKISKSLMFFAAAIGILAAAFWLLSKVKFEDTGTAVIGLVASMGVIVVAMDRISKLTTSEGVLKMPAIALALILLGSSLLLLGKAVVVFASVKPDRLIPAMAALTWGLLIMVGALDVLTKDPKKFIGAAVSMNILAGALVTMAGAIAILGLMPIEALVQGGIALAGILVFLTIFSAFPSENVLKAGQAMGILALSLLVMVAAIAILGNMDMATLIQGGGALAVMITALVVAVSLMKGSGEGAAAMIAMAAAVAILAAAIKVFGDMKVEALKNGIGTVILLLLGLVVAANMMEKTVPGAAAMIVMAIAIGILTFSIEALAQIPAQAIFTALLAITGGLAILLVAALAAQLVAPGLFILAGAILAIGIAVLAGGAGMVLFAMGLATVGVAAQAAIPGLMAFAQACGQMMPYIAAMVAVSLAIGALAIAVFGLGIAFVVLGGGLLTMGAGLALLSAFGGLGAIALLAVWKALEPLIWEIPKMTLLGGAFLALGVGLLALGAGLAVTAIGTALLAIGMLAFVGAGFAFAATLDSVRMAFERFLPITTQITTLTDSLNTFGGTFRELNIALLGMSSSLVSVSTGFSVFVSSTGSIISGLQGIETAVGQSSSKSKAAFNVMLGVFIVSAIALGAATRGIGIQVQNGSRSIQTSLNGIIEKVAEFAIKLAAKSASLDSAATTMLSAFGTTINTKLATIKTEIHSKGSSIGDNLTAGMKRGIENGTGDVVSAARSMAKKVIQAIKEEYKIKSPSKVMEEIGKYVKEGFYKGLTGFEDEPVHRVTEAVNKMKTDLKKAIDDAGTEIATANAKIAKLNKKKKKSKQDKEDLKDAKALVAQLKTDKANAEAAMAQLDGILKTHQDELMKISDQYYAKVEEVKNAQKALDDANQALIDGEKRFREKFSSLPEFAEEGDLVNTYIDDLSKQIEATKKFSETLAILRSMKLDDTTYSKLLEKGISAQPFIDALIESGQLGIDEINKLDAELTDQASALGKIAASEMYQSGIDAAEGFLKGLQSKEAALKAQMTNLGTIIVDTIKTQLGIQSPSRVLMGVGGYTMLGLMQGMQKYIPALEKTTEDVGDAAVDGLRKAIDEIGSSVYGEMDMSPVIRPVLDLTDVEKSAKSLGSVFDSRTIDLNSTYADVSSLAFAARQRELLIQQRQEDSDLLGESITYIQNNNSPKALTNAEIYRQTRNQLSTVKKGLSI